MENTNTHSFEDVKVFAGDNAHPASDATYKNLIWENNGKIAIIQIPTSVENLLKNLSESNLEYLLKGKIKQIRI